MTESSAGKSEHVYCGWKIRIRRRNGLTGAAVRIAWVDDPTSWAPPYPSRYPHSEGATTHEAARGTLTGAPTEFVLQFSRVRSGVAAPPPSGSSVADAIRAHARAAPPGATSCGPAT